jgi:hypothetical protein
MTQIRYTVIGGEDRGMRRTRGPVESAVETTTHSGKTVLLSGPSGRATDPSASTLPRSSCVGAYTLPGLVHRKREFASF